MSPISLGHSLKFSRRHLLAIAAASLPQLTAATDWDWPQWRGPNRDGITEDFHEPLVWPPVLHMRWKAEVGSGFSSPVYHRGRIYVHTRRDPAEETVSCLDARDGRVVWRHSYPAPFRQNSYAIHMGAGPNSTPLVACDRIYTLGMTGILSCFHAGSGTLEWRKDWTSRVDTSRYFTGTAMSPLIAERRLIVQIGDDREGMIQALDPGSGRVRWSWDADAMAYSSPITASFNGVRLVIGLTDKLAVGLKLDTGKLLWSFPFRDPENENILTPIFHGKLLILSGIRNGTFAYRLSRLGDRWTTDQVWHNPVVHMHMSSPVLDRGLVFGHSYKKKGQFFCLDAQTGATRWLTSGREGEHASAICSKSLLFLLTERAELLVAKKNSEEFGLVARYKVSEGATWPHPILLDRAVLIKDDSSVALWTID